MLPDNIYNSYLEYKKDTNTYINWLCSTATRIGFPPPYKSSLESTASKSQARKKKKLEEREVSISGLIACAEAIVEKPPRQFVVPVYAAQCAARAIRQRKKSSQWHESQVDGLDGIEKVVKEEDNAGHTFFTETLEHTLNILRPFICNAQHANKTGDKAQRHHSMDDITNRFSRLEIEELADQEVESAAVAVAEKPPTTSRIRYVVDNSEEERQVAMESLLHDHLRIKQAIRKAWQEYLLDRNLDLITTAATTQAGLQMLRSLVHEFTMQFPELKSMETFCSDYLRKRKDIQSCSDKAIPVDTSDANVQIPKHVAEFSCLDTYTTIQHALSRFFQDEKYARRYRVMEAMLRDGYFDDYKTDMPALQPLVNALEDVLGMDVDGMGSFQDPPIMDNFTQLWREYLQTLYSAPKSEGQEKRELPDLSVELVLCTDLYLKVQEVVTLAEPNIIRDDYKNNWVYKNYYQNDSDSGHILELLKQYPFTSNSIRKTLTSFFRSDADTAKVVDWHTREKFWFRRVSMKEKITGIRISGREDCAVGVFRWDWPRYNPFLAGLIAFVVAQAVDEFNTVTQNHSGSPVATAHLYNYLRQAHSVIASSPCTPVLAKEWPDMEAYLKIMGDKSVFGGDRPRTLRHCLQQAHWLHNKLKDPLRAISEENGNGYTPPAWDNEDTIPLHIIWHESRHQERTSSLNYETRKVNSQPTYRAASVIEETFLSSNSRPKVPSYGTRKFEEMIKAFHCINPLDKEQEEFHAQHWAEWVLADEEAVQKSADEVLNRKGMTELCLPPSFRELIASPSAAESSPNLPDEETNTRNQQKEISTADANKAAFEGILRLLRQARADNDQMKTAGLVQEAFARLGALGGDHVLAPEDHQEIVKAAEGFLGKGVSKDGHGRVYYIRVGQAAQQP
ncbi:uncharacterized protein J4E79_006645 [Alternaria viburni]|uniref:uncharacterized protein n=1 Tax=Alternaria viburni TaxID=566460 RepID=UPI0020C4DC43|nr:uncharacterized protein J4E79_006645 [Alternaria viburni]KAI4658885.1 hypothetical protein J4E79_006645 [Alternaria viburni]